MNNFFSIVIPCTNLSGSLIETLRSIDLDVLEKTEVIIVMDTKLSEQYFHGINNFENIRISIISCHRRQGASEARNIGVKNASNAWISFIDSDDIWLKGRYKILINHISTY